MKRAFLTEVSVVKDALEEHAGKSADDTTEDSSVCDSTVWALPVNLTSGRFHCQSHPWSKSRARTLRQEIVPQRVCMASFKLTSKVLMSSKWVSTPAEDQTASSNQSSNLIYASDALRFCHQLAARPVMQQSR